MLRRVHPPMRPPPGSNAAQAARLTGLPAVGALLRRDAGGGDAEAQGQEEGTAAGSHGDDWGDSGGGGGNLHGGWGSEGSVVGERRRRRGGGGGAAAGVDGALLPATLHYIQIIALLGSGARRAALGVGVTPRTGPATPPPPQPPRRNTWHVRQRLNWATGGGLLAPRGAPGMRMPLARPDPTPHKQPASPVTAVKSLKRVAQGRERCDYMGILHAPATWRARETVATAAAGWSWSWSCPRRQLSYACLHTHCLPIHRPAQVCT